MRLNYRTSASTDKLLSLALPSLLALCLFDISSSLAYTKQLQMEVSPGLHVLASSGLSTLLCYGLSSVFRAVKVHALDFCSKSSSAKMLSPEN